MEEKLMGMALALAAILIGLPVQGEAWLDRAVEAFGKGDFEEALTLAKESTGGPGNAPRIVKFFSHLERSILTRDRADTVAWRQDYKPLYAAIVMEDIPLLLDLEGKERPYTKKYAGAFLEIAHKKVAALQDVGLIRGHLHGRDPRTGAAATAALGKLLSIRRKVVETGGTLSDEDQEVFTDPGIIRPLVEMVGREQTAGEKAKGLIPKGLRRDYASARPDDCLVYIEAPAIPYLEEVLEKRGPRTHEVLGAIRGALAKRIEMFPDSNWASATGKEPSRGGEAVVAVCSECKVSEGGRFCSKCGSTVKP